MTIQTSINLSAQETSFTWPSKGDAKIVHVKNRETNQATSQYQMDTTALTSMNEQFSEHIHAVRELRGQYRFVIDGEGGKVLVQYEPGNKQIGVPQTNRLA